MRILLPLEDTPQAAEVLVWARRFRSALVAPPLFVALHVVPIRIEGALGVLEEYAAGDLEDARTRLNAMLAGDRDIEVRIRAGSPGPVICDEAAGFDLVAIRASGRTQLSELVLGSTSAYVVHHAPCHVLVVRPAGERNGTHP